MKFEIPNEKKEIKIKGLNSLKFCYLCESFNINNKWNQDFQKIFDFLKENTILIDKKKGKEFKLREIIPLEDLKLVYSQRFTWPLKLIFENGDEYVVEIEYFVTICEQCKKSEGTYHEAVIQLRGVNKEILTELVQELVKKEVFIKERVDKKEGIDLKVSNKRAARSISQKIAKKYGLELKLTSKLITYKHDKGKEVYRDFILLRTVPKDFVYYKGKFWVIKNNKLVDLENKEKIPLPQDSSLLEKVDVEKLEKISEDREGSYFMDKEYNTYYFKAKEAYKLQRGQENAFYLIKKEE
jgi:NMD protein affecting ribosome stability and mRNA decay